MRLELQLIGIKVVIVLLLLVCVSFDHPTGVRLVLWSAAILVVLSGSTATVLLVRRLVYAMDLVIERANQIEGGNLTGPPLLFTRPEQVRLLSRSVNTMQTRLAEMIGTIASTSSALTTNAGSMTAYSEQIHRRISLQSQQTEQAAAAMTEMSVSIAEVSRHTQSAAETAREAAQTAHAGGAIVHSVLDSMQQIARAVSDAAGVIEVLGEESQRISRIIVTIDEVAKKTNLLALNAAIEAARAGDQGRGFAVVAGEVRRLAESTGKSTGEIAGMIQAIQQRIGSAVQGMQAGTALVGDGVATTRQAGEALERIIGMAERVDRMIAQIAVAASQQAAAANESSNSLDQIHALSNENLQEMTSTSRGIAELRETAEDMGAEVERYVVAIDSGIKPRRRRAA